MRTPGIVSALAVGAILLLSACGNGGENALVLGATTSVQDTALLDEIVSAFEERSGYHVTPVVGGSGQILEQAKQGELDVVLTHSPTDEAAFVARGYGLEPRKVMENYFVVAGPPDDPAEVAKTSTLQGAFRVIAEAGAPFVSRGDASGTHQRELSIWRSLGIDPAGQDWYQEYGVGQAQSLLAASDKDAYTLVDSSTMAILRVRVRLTPFVTDREEPNVYTVILVNPANHSQINEAAARAFADFVTSPEAQRLIAEFRRAEFGEALFVPLAGDPSTAATP